MTMFEHTTMLIPKQLHNQFMFHDNSFTSRNLQSLIMIKHITKVITN